MPKYDYLVKPFSCNNQKKNHLKALCKENVKKEIASLHKGSLNHAFLSDLIKRNALALNRIVLIVCQVTL